METWRGRAIYTPCPAPLARHAPSISAYAQFPYRCCVGRVMDTYIQHGNVRCGHPGLFENGVDWGLVLHIFIEPCVADLGASGGSIEPHAYTASPHALAIPGFHGKWQIGALHDSTYQLRELLGRHRVADKIDVSPTQLPDNSTGETRAIFDWGAPFGQVLLEHGTLLCGARLRPRIQFGDQWALTARHNRSVQWLLIR